MRAKLLEATRGYFKDDLSAEAAIDIIMGILKDNGYRLTVGHIDRAVEMARNMGKECIIVIGAEPPMAENPEFRRAPFKIDSLDFNGNYIPLEKRNHKRKSSREI